MPNMNFGYFQIEMSLKDKQDQNCSVIDHNLSN